MDNSDDFIYLHDSFNNTVNSSDYIASDERLINESERMWKEEVMA
jgi:hypothetical protein